MPDYLPLRCLAFVSMLVLIPQAVFSWGQEPPFNSDGQVTANQGEQFYITQVKPILEAHCFACHGNDPEELRGSLALNSRAAILQGGDSGAAVDLESPAESLLLRAINYDTYEMPPSGKLPARKIEILAKWVEMGLPFPAAEEVEIAPPAHSSVPQVTEETKRWWSFQPVKRPEVPRVAQQSWPRNEVDNFILCRLEQVSLPPAPEATRQQLIRRASYDLIGLPPTPAQVDAFVNDPDPNAYENLIEDLLDSPHYGEKWGRHWLDLVRYAESNSFERDGTKPFVWRYRDYVIQSFNADKPYDQFLVEQLAGDEIENPTRDSIIATGYYRLGPWQDEPVDPLQAKFDDLDDIVATTCQTMLGLTVNCARCHDHKIDPIPQQDYYSLVAFFENIQRFGVRSEDSVFAASVKTLPGDATEEQKRQHAEQVREIEQRLNETEELVKPDFEAVEHEEFQYRMNRIPLLEKRVGSILKPEQFEEYKLQAAQLENLRGNPPGSIQVLCVKENGSNPPESFVRVRGNANVKGEQVSPAFVSVLSPPQPEFKSNEGGETTGRRLELANWIASPENPLTARVIANRIWQYHFGRGLVRSSSDFGFQGTPPTHPELLDWLATELIRQNWSMKSMHRIMMGSSAYRMSSRFDQTCDEIDPSNDLFWRFNLRRLTAEEIRDSILEVNGQLNRTSMFGPSIFTKLPPEVLAGQSRPGEGWGTSSEQDRRRRSIYVHVKRSVGDPLLQTNDSADTDNTCPVRFITTQPTQALGMLNSAFTNEQAALFAADVARLHQDTEDQVREVLLRVLQRSPTKVEVDRGVELVVGQTANQSVTRQQALEYFCLLAINLNEFVYID